MRTERIDKMRDFFQNNWHQNKNQVSSKIKFIPSKIHILIL